jgi:hypothetical protein
MQSKDNLEIFKQKIPFKLLPRKLQDAVIATRRLARDVDVRYLWIDTLCIIQDSKDDWETEASIMGNIYRTAYLILAATFSSNGNVVYFRQEISFHFNHAWVIHGGQTQRHSLHERIRGH